MNTDYRPERILWLGYQLSKLGKWFTLWWGIVGTPVEIKEHPMLN
jgi:hypothetical protein